jgi:hypothetical protein
MINKPDLHGWLARATRADPTRFGLYLVENDFLPWAIGAGANVESQASFVGDPNLSGGVTAGIAQSAQANKLWRQTTFIGSCLASLNVLVTGLAQLDNGVVDTMIANIWQMIVQAGYFPDVGAANAYLTANPSGLTFPAPTVGLAVDILIANTNTGASTFNWMGNGNVAVVNGAGNALSGGELKAGRLVRFVFDGTHWQVGAAPTAAVTGSTAGLAGSSLGANQLASWTVSQLIAATTIGGQLFKGTGLTLSFNGASANGPNAMDTGSMPLSNDLSIYAIYNPVTNTWATLGYAGSSQNAPIYPGGHMPAGYVASALLWAGVTDSSRHFQTFAQFGGIVYTANVTVASGFSGGSLTSTTLAAIVPAAALTAQISAFAGTNGVYDNLIISGSITVGFTTLGVVCILAANSLGLQVTGGFCPLPTPQTVWLLTSNGVGNFTVKANGYTIF